MKVTGRRTYGSYNDGCAAAHALDLVGERWSLSVVRELLLGPKRFSELQRDVPGIGPTTLTRRLESLVQAGVVQRSPAGVSASSDGYVLTAWGYELESVNAALAAWGAKSPSQPLEADMSPDTIVLAMRAHARPVPQLSEERSVLLSIRDDLDSPVDRASYEATLSASSTTIVRASNPGHDAEYDAVITSTASSLKAVVISGAPYQDLAGLTFHGDSQVVENLISATRL